MPGGSANLYDGDQGWPSAGTRVDQTTCGPPDEPGKFPDASLAVDQYRGQHPDHFIGHRYTPVLPLFWFDPTTGLDERLLSKSTPLSVDDHPDHNEALLGEGSALFDQPLADRCPCRINHYVLVAHPLLVAKTVRVEPNPVAVGASQYPA
ncbi:uncharacterized protein METZ01_LOCUS97031, partial [marine metagenome]